MKERFWNEEVKKGVESLSKEELEVLVLDIWDTATIVYVDETDTQRIMYVENRINKLIGIE
ncbi:MAG: hypothetical protein E6582_14325 [Clostridium sp.]|uniref:hypothetical protein n=1 Tax=Clostridium sp. TaxID=1506 RepID=UPI002910772A|nr:hypothetical protein [Clostridium sp.]MDU6364682.1 hypothetical protein [Clostridium sp.]